MKLTKNDAVELLYGLMEVDAPHMGGHFNYKVSKNIELLKRVEKNLDKEKYPSDAFIKASQERRALNEKYAEKDENGEPKKYVHKRPDNTGVEKYVIPGIDDPNSEYNKEMSAFNEKNKEVFEQREAQVEKFNKSLDDEIEVDLQILKVEPIPNGLSRNAMNALSKIIHEDHPVNKDPEPEKTEK
jgi:hypothetical protein